MLQQLRATSAVPQRAKRCENESGGNAQDPLRMLASSADPTDGRFGGCVSDILYDSPSAQLPDNHPLIEQKLMLCSPRGRPMLPTRLVLDEGGNKHAAIIPVCGTQVGVSCRPPKARYHYENLEHLLRFGSASLPSARQAFSLKGN